MDAETHGNEESMRRFGDREDICFEVSWLGEGFDNVAEATNAELVVWVANELIWGTEDTSTGETHPVEWSLVDILDFLATRWMWLECEESYPIDPPPMHPSRLWEIAEQNWETAEIEPEPEEEEAVWEFEQCHDLSHAIPGARLPSIWLMRQGNQLVVDAGSGLVTYPDLAGGLETLESFGRFICERLQRVDDPIADERISSWEERKDIDAQTQAEIYTNLPEDALEGLWAHSANGPESDEFEPDEVFALARQLGGSFSGEELEGVADRIYEITRREVYELDNLSEQLLDDPFWRGGRPFEEGHRLANWLRDELCNWEDYNSRSPISPSEVLETWNVEIDSLTLPDPRVDAIAVWGPKHGPAVLLNEEGQHAQNGRGRRATLAHEICHLLVDRWKALPLAEVLNSSAPRILEKRANAFAAELLLPRRIAGDRARDAREHGRSVDKLIRNLCTSYGVSRELMAWQVRRSDVYSTLPKHWQRTLRGKVSNPADF